MSRRARAICGNGKRIDKRREFDGSKSGSGLGETTLVAAMARRSRLQESLRVSRFNLRASHQMRNVPLDIVNKKRLCHGDRAGHNPCEPKSCMGCSGFGAFGYEQLGTGWARHVNVSHRYYGSPVLSLRMQLAVCGFLKSNMVMMEPAMASKEPLPIRWPPSQLSSIKRMIELWSVMVWST